MLNKKKKALDKNRDKYSKVSEVYVCRWLGGGILLGEFDSLGTLLRGKFLAGSLF